MSSSAATGRPGQPPDESGRRIRLPAAAQSVPQRSVPGHRATRGHTHGHLWSLPDGTGLHAPYGELVTEAGTGRICCHLCGRWFVSLGGHLRAHGYTAESYREATGLCWTRRLVAETLSRSIATRQQQAYRRSSAVRARLAVGQELSRNGQLTSLARTARGTGIAGTSSDSARGAGGRPGDQGGAPPQGPHAAPERTGHRQPRRLPAPRIFGWSEPAPPCQGDRAGVATAPPGDRGGRYSDAARRA
ncbi:MAG: MucR family transcriptional regulator [Pseudonocardiaceae bacterium]